MKGTLQHDPFWGVPSNGFKPEVVRYNLEYLRGLYSQFGNTFMDALPLLRRAGVIAHTIRVDGTLEAAVLKGRDRAVLNLPEFNGKPPVTESVSRRRFEDFVSIFAEAYGRG